LNRLCKDQLTRKPPEIAGTLRAMEDFMTDTLTVHTLTSTASSLVAASRLECGTRRDTLSAAIDEYRAAVSTNDVALAWLSAGLVGLSLLALGGAP